MIAKFNRLSMNKIFFMLSMLILLGAGCTGQSIWQGAYYDQKIDKRFYSSMFNSYEECKDWAMKQEHYYSNQEVSCFKNCKNVLADGTPQCEKVIRNWAPFIGSDTFENYKE